MLAKLHSIAINGIDAIVVEVELDVARGMPGMVMVGLPDKAVQESRERVKSAIQNSKFHYPNKKVVVNLAPAELKKEGGIYDLPIALAMLAASEQLDLAKLDDYIILGELALDGRLRPVRGVLAAAITAQQKNYRGVIIPLANAAEAMVLGDDIDVIGVDTLSQAVDFLEGSPTKLPVPVTEELEQKHVPDFLDVRGHESLKRALTVAAAGAHNIAMMGPPGSGKTMCAKRLPGILPELSYEESLETTKIFSIAGELKPGQGLLKVRPFRSPHHSVSAPGLVGGGANPRPGEVSMAHNGVLFLDEAPEFTRNILETLRQPLEDGIITISRASGSVTYPARMMLIISQNLCPCGKRGDPRKRCNCSPRAIEAYLERLSGPLLDRIDLHVEVPALSYDELRGDRTGQSSEVMRNEVVRAREVQKKRLPHKASPVNSQLSEHEIEEFCKLDSGCELLLKSAMQELGLSARGHARILKVSRTIADLGGSDNICQEHIGEAILYRTLDRTASY